MPGFTAIATSPATPDRTFAFILELSNWTLFRGYGPLPGIVSATLDGEWGPGARVRVENTDGSVHHEVVQAFEPGRRYAIAMDLTPPASTLMDRIVEDVHLEALDSGTRVVRTFEVVPRAWWTAPMAWLITHLLLKPAVRRHDVAVGQALATSMS